MPRRLFLLFFLFASSGLAAEKRVVLVSVDGLRPDYYLEPESHEVELPNFEKLEREGAYAEAVEPVFPSVTYPAHTTIVTGVRPNRHGILNNYVFDETARFDDWYWYAKDIRAPTLWDVAPGTTAGFHWPVTVGADIDYNFPEFWDPGSDVSWRDVRADVTTPELLEAIERDVGRLPDAVIDEAPLENLAFDAAELILERYRPQLLLLHVFNTDTQQHRYGREHEEVASAFQLVDRRLGRLRKKIASLGLADETLLVVTGDHGFIQVHTDINLNAAFREAGLLELGVDGTVHDYRAMVWPAGGSCAVMLRDPEDSRTRRKVEDLVDGLLEGPLGGAMTKLPRDAVERLGAMPGALFMLAAREGYVFGKKLEGDVLTPSGDRGHHGFLATHARMQTGFLMVGPRVRAGVRIPRMRQIDIAPTIAAWAGWELPNLEGLAMRGLFEEVP